MKAFSVTAVTVTSWIVLAAPLAAQDLDDFEGGAFEIITDESTGQQVGYSVPVSPPTSNRMTAEEALAELAARGVELPVSLPRAGSPVGEKMTAQEERQRSLDRVLSHVDSIPADEPVDLIVKLRDVELEDVSSARNLDEQAARAAFDLRRSQILDAQQSYLRHVLQHGEVVAQGYVSNALHVRLPAGTVRDAIDHQDVKSVHPGWYKVVPDYDGQQLRDATFLQNLVDDGFTGETGGRHTSSSDNIKIAVIETRDDLSGPNALNTSHPGWLDWTGGPSRIISNWNCLGGCGPAAASTVATHGTIVSWVAAGSIEQGQDPNHTSRSARSRRSGVAREAELYYFRVFNAADVFNALGWAAFAGADVINMSLRIAGCQNFCDRNLDCAGINDQLETVTNAGTLVVKSTSNRNVAGSLYPNDVDCNVTYPGWRPEVVSVGNVNTTGSTDYDSASIAASSSRGWVTVGVGGSWSQYYPNGLNVPAVSITAPGVVSLFFAENDEYQDTSASFFYSAEVSGTSFAAPVVTGAAGLLRQSMPTFKTNARMLKTLVLLMGDGNDARNTGPGWEEGTSEVWGTGKLKAHRPTGLPAPGASIFYTTTVTEGQEKFQPFPSGSIPTGVKQWKWVAFIDERDLDEVPWIWAEVEDTCNSGIVVGSDIFFSPVKYVSLTDPQVKAGRCLRMRLYGLSVPSGGVTVYNAAYYSSGDPDDH